MLCREVMNPDPLVCRETDTVFLCAQLMRRYGVGFVPVVDDDDRPVGIVTDRDLAVRVLAERRPSSTPVFTVMTTDVVACQDAEDLRSAEERMAEARRSRLVVLDSDGRCVGVISLSDVAHTESRTRTGQLVHAVTSRKVRRRPTIPA
jgi:CBS domain-containing protein